MNPKVSMEINVLVMVFVLGGLWDMETEAVSLTAEEGDDIKLKCSHSNAFSNIKYFCKGRCNSKDVLITSMGKPEVSNGKYSIRDEGNTFYVTISDLTVDDSGVYWCGIDRVGVDTFNQVILTVTENRNSPEGISQHTSSSKKLLYIGVSLGVVVLALATGLVIFIKHHNRDSKSTGQDQHAVYAAPSKQRRRAPREAHTSAANEHLERGSETTSISAAQRQDANTQGAGANVTVSSEGQAQADGVFYSSVSFNKHTVAPRTLPTVTYSVVRRKSTDESTVYSNV